MSLNIRLALFFALLLTHAFLVPIQAEPASSQPAGASDFEYTSHSIGHFSIGDRVFRILPSVNNKPGNVSRWQFVYMPLFFPAVHGQTLAVSSEPFGSHGTYVTSLAIHLDWKVARLDARHCVSPAYNSRARDGSTLLRTVPMIGISG